MPEIGFFSTQEDQTWLIELSFSFGFCIVPELDYDTPDLIYLNDYSEYQEFASQTNRFYLLYNQLISSPLETWQVDSGWRAGKYVIVQRHGGPTLDLLCNKLYDENGVVTMSSGFLGFYATYKNTLTGKLEKIPNVVRAQYHRIVREIKACSRQLNVECIEGGTRPYWILPDALSSLRKGARLVDFFHDAFLKSQSHC